jgi:hypothetical protein
VQGGDLLAFNAVPTLALISCSRRRGMKKDKKERIGEEGGEKVKRDKIRDIAKCDKIYR